MNKIFKYALFGMLFLLSIVGIKEVHAETYTGQAIWPSEYISNIYLKKVKPDGYTKYQQARFIRRSEDNQFVYCLQPYTDIDNNLPYYDVIREDYEKVLGLSESQWDRISLLAYYGYGYGNHTDQKWYVITQVMIWRTTNPESDIYFTDTLNGSRVNKFDGEIAELESLVSNHYKRPSLTLPSTLPLGQSVTINDANGVLNKYKVTSASNVSASINGNSLTIKATGIGDAKINLALKDTKYDLPPIVYFSNHSQNVMRVGSYDPIYTSATLKIIGGRVEINKLDSSCNCKTPQGEATLAGAKYGVYDTSGKLLETLTTDSNAYAISGYLPSLGEFIIKEIEPSKGYTLDKNTYAINIDENNLLASVNVFERVISGEMKITKVIATSETKVMTPEANIKFGIYNNKNELVKEVTTDKNGEFTVKLPYGSYTLKQLTTTKGYEYAKDYKLNIDIDGKVIKEVLSNAEITAKLKVIKIDKDTGEVIKRSGIKFKIKSLKTNDYVCQKVTYPKAETLCEFKTDDEGVLITPYPLNSGDYVLEEVDQVIDGYTWNKESVPFSIDENTKFTEDEEYGVLFETKFDNKEVKGKITIKKIGETYIIKDNKIEYTTKNLSDITFGLYASEDIYSANEVLKYKKDELIGTYKTNKDGNIVVENLYLGKYYVKEIETDDDHVLDEKKHEFELKYKDQYTEVISIGLELNNKLKTGELEFTKTDLTTGKVIPNTKLEIYTENDELIYEGITDEEGKIKIEKLPMGKYYIIETEAATGYRLSEEKVLFEVKENGEIVKANMTNEKKKGTLEFTKQDFSTSETLPNTLIEIYNEDDELVFSGRTDENGKIVIEELEYGKYYILEKEAPEGYYLNEEKMYFEILEDGEIVKCTMTDEKVIVEVPNTEENNYIIPISLILMVGATGVVIYEEIKKRKNKNK